MTRPELKLHFGDALFITVAEGRRLEKVLRRLDFALDVNDPVTKLPEEKRLQVIFKRCRDGNVYKIPNAFKVYAPTFSRGH